MNLTVRYETRRQSFEISVEDMEKMWVSLKLETEASLTNEEKAEKLQEAFDKEFNRPEFNNWHRENRHVGQTYAKPDKEKDEGDVDLSEPLIEEVRDDRIFYQDDIRIEHDLEYEDVCSWVRETLHKKPSWAEAFIAVRIDGMSVNEYTRSIGLTDPNIITQWLKRAQKKLKENYGKRQI